MRRDRWCICRSISLNVMLTTADKYRLCRLLCLPFIWQFLFILTHTHTRTHARTHTHTHARTHTYTPLTNSLLLRRLSSERHEFEGRLQLESIPRDDDTVPRVSCTGTNTEITSLPSGLFRDSPLSDELPIPDELDFDPNPNRSADFVGLSDLSTKSWASPRDFCSSLPTDSQSYWQMVKQKGQVVSKSERQITKSTSHHYKAWLESGSRKKNQL